MDESLDRVCQACINSLKEGNIPLMALANGKWLSKVPAALANLSYAEQLLVAKV
jgi:hypothetical protein